MVQNDNSNNSESNEKINSAVGTAGVNSSQVYADSLKFQARQGHGFAAEQANNVEDILAGKDARVVGNDNALNGPDRAVNGTYIQTNIMQHQEIVSTPVWTKTVIGNTVTQMVH